MMKKMMMMNQAQSVMTIVKYDTTVGQRTEVKIETKKEKKNRIVEVIKEIEEEESSSEEEEVIIRRVIMKSTKEKGRTKEDELYNLSYQDY